jgi:hypothetical protein
MLEHPVKRNVLLRGYCTELAVNLSVYFTFRDNIPHKQGRARLASGGTNSSDFLVNVILLLSPHEQ